MNKTVSKNPVLRFKLGLKVKIGKNGLISNIINAAFANPLGLLYLYLTNSLKKLFFGDDTPKLEIKKGRDTINSGNNLTNSRKRINYNQNFLNLISNPEYKQALENANVNINDVKAVLRLVGTKDDGLWGNKSLTAFQLWYNNMQNSGQGSDNPASGVIGTDNQGVEINNTPTPVQQAQAGKKYGTYFNFNTMNYGNVDATLEEMKNMKKILTAPASLRTSTPVYDRTMTRNWITDNLGTNPYQYTGTLRRALRYWLNGDREGLNYDKNLLGVFGDLSLYAKKGGTLTTKNPIQRFKNNFFRKVAQ